jgi:Flp pilus assembly protein TadD
VPNLASAIDLGAIARRHEADGRPAAARQAWRALAAMRPDVAVGEVNLARLCQAAGEPGQAAALFRRAHRRMPGDGATLHRLGRALRRAGDSNAGAALRAAIAIAPARTAALCDLAGLQLERRDYAGADEVFGRALHLDPGDGAATSGRAFALLARESDHAADMFRRALLLAPQDVNAAQGLSAALAARDQGMAAHRPARWSVRMRPVTIGWAAPRTGARALRLLILRAIGHSHFVPAGGTGARVSEGHNNAESFMRGGGLARSTLWVDGTAPTPGLVAALRRHDAVYCAISDADVMGNALPAAERWVTALGLPVINRPARLWRTTRDALPRTIGAVPGLCAPPAARVSGGLDAALAAMSAHGLRYPVLARWVGTHNADSLTRCVDEADLAGFFEGASGDFYLTQYVDFSGADGYYRKLRFFSIAGRLHPIHLFVSEGWEVRGHDSVRALMRGSPRLLGECRSFLEDPKGYLGAAAHAALEGVVAAIGLDVLGIDFAVLPDGRPIVFEANASMSHHYAFVTDFPFSKTPLDRASRAFRDLAIERCSAAPDRR